MKDSVLSWTNRIVAVFLLAVGIFVLAYSLCNLEFGSFSKPKGGFVPVVFSVGLIAFGFINVMIEFCRKPSVPAKFDGINWKRAVFYYIECIVYVLLIDKIGFLADTIIILFIMLKQCGTRGWLKPIVITLAASFFIWAVFKYAMGIALPPAIWF